MKRLVLGAAVAGGAAFAAPRLVRKGRELHDHCRELVRGRCSRPSAGCGPR